MRNILKLLCIVLAIFTAIAVLIVQHRLTVGNSPYLHVFNQAMSLFAALWFALTRWIVISRNGIPVFPGFGWMYEGVGARRINYIELIIYYVVAVRDRNCVLARLTACPEHQLAELGRRRQELVAAGDTGSRKLIEIEQEMCYIADL